jgi:hypothetical protein
MRGIIAFVVVVIIAFFAVPMAAEGTTDTCQALERHVVTAQATNIAGGNTNSATFSAVNGAGQSQANGAIASTMMQQNHPDTPTPISCTYFYWKSLL